MPWDEPYMPRPEVLANWAELRARQWGGGAELALCFDFDGTLAPLVDRPDDATIHPATLIVLNRLLRWPRVSVAIFSGRSLVDLERRVPGEWSLYALCGLEARISGKLIHHPDIEHFEKTIREVVRSLRGIDDELPGAWVEDKGRAATVHFRPCSVTDKQRGRTVVEARLGGMLDSLRMLTGPDAVELFPITSPTKGDALRSFAHSFPATAPVVDYFGDSENDLPAWKMAREIGGTGWFVGPQACPEGLCAVGQSENLAEILQLLEQRLSVH